MIRFAIEHPDFKLNDRLKIKHWIKIICETNQVKIGNIQYIFVTKERILEINRQFLKHDYFTDIITFDYREEDVLSGDIFLSVDTIRENARIYQEDSQKEFLRVIIHGILHLIGFNDHTETEQAVMRQEEEKALLLWQKQNSI